jgi:hypothetical protein
MFHMYFCPKNQEICVQFEHTKHVAVLFAQSRLKNVANEVFNCALLVQKCLLLQMGHINSCPFTATVSGSDFVNSPIIIESELIKI